MTKRLNEDELVRRERSRREAQEELCRLKERYPELRKTMSAEAIAVAWFLYGDEAWKK